MEQRKKMDAQAMPSQWVWDQEIRKAEVLDWNWSCSLKIRNLHFTSKHINDLLKDIDKLVCKPASILIDPNHKLEPIEEDTEVDKEIYKILVGRLIYLSHTKPNIIYVISVISQFMHDFQ